MLALLSRTRAAPPLAPGSSTPAITQAAAGTSPRSAALELVLTFACVELHLWYFTAAGPSALKTANLALLVAVLVWSFGRRWRQWLKTTPGPLARAWGEALGVSLILSLFLLAIVAGAGLWTDAGGVKHFTLKTSTELAVWAYRKLLTVAGQQVALHGLMVPLLLEWLGAARSSTNLRWLARPDVALAASSLAFGALHLPNPLLTLLATVASAIWIWLFRRSGRVLPLVCSHLLLAMLARGVCYEAVYNMRVGVEALELLPSSVTLDDGTSLVIRPLSIDGGLESLVPAGEEMICRGWAAYIVGERPADAILVVHNGTAHRFPVQGLSRPVIAEWLRVPALEYCGYELRLKRSWFSPGHDLRFFAEMAPDRRAELCYTPDLPILLGRVPRSPAK